MSAAVAVDLAWTEQGAGPPLLLIMGLNAPGSAWQPHVEQWARSWRCVMVDNRGAGRSPAPPGPYRTGGLAEDYARLIRRLALGPCRVVGISLGGAIAQELALRHPDLVERLVLVATWSRPHPYTGAVLEGLAALREAVDEPTFTAHLQTLVWTPEWFAAHPDELVAGRSVAPAVGPSALVAQVAACRDHHTFDRLARIEVPTLVTAGGVDRFVPASCSEEIAARVPDARLEVFAGTGHVHHWEELVRFNRLVEEFLS